MRRIDNSSSQDGVETTSITSSIENEVRKPPTKAKRNSIKKKIPNFNDDSDDTVNEPLLQSENDISEFNRSAKFVSSKSKTDSINERAENTKIGIKEQKTSPTTTAFSGNINFKNVTTDIASAGTSVTAPIYNYMNTNIFGAIDTNASKSSKSTIIVEIDNIKSSAYNPSPLIFTTAKIHTENKTKNMQPLQLTPVPILSTIEGNVIKSIPSTYDSSEKHYDIVKSKSESQEKSANENKQNTIKNTTNIKERSATTSSNMKSTIDVTRPVSGQITKQTALDKPFIAQTDSKIPITSAKVEIMNNTTNILQDEKTRITAVEKAKKNITDKSVEEPSKLEVEQKSVKTNNEKQVLLIDESQKKTSNGITNKTTNLTSSRSENTSNKDKPTNSVSPLSMNKQLQRQKKTVDNSISDDKNQTTVCDPNINISQEDSASLPESKARAGIISPTMPKTSLESQKVVTKLPIKSSNNMSNSSAPSDKPSFISSVPKGSVNIMDKTSPVPSGKGKNEPGSISGPIEKKNIPDKSGSLISVPKGKTASTYKPVSLTSTTTVISTDKSKIISKTSPLTSVPSGKANNTDKPGPLNSTSTLKTNTTDKPVSLSSVPEVKTNTINKPSSLTSVPLSKGNVTNKPDSSSSVSAGKPNTTTKPGSVESLASGKANTTENSVSLTSTSKGTSNATSKPGSVNSVPTDKVNTAAKSNSVKSASAEHANIAMPSSTTSASVTKDGRKETITTTSGLNISKSANTAKSSGKESVEVKKAFEKPKTKISPILKSESPVTASDSKSTKSIPFSATTNVSPNVTTNKKLETHATSSSSATASEKGNIVSSLPSSSTSAKTLIGTNKNIEPKFSENNKDSRA